MTAYIANHQKKQRIFEKRERELLHAIKHGHSSELLALAAERLRAAKVSVFKCRFVANRPTQSYEFKLDRLGKTKRRQLERWLSMTPEEIVAMYETDPE